MTMNILCLLIGIRMAFTQ